MSLLATVGIAALAALGASGNLGSSAEVSLCSVHPAAFAELAAALEPATLSPRAPGQELCVERDGAPDPRCRSEGDGHRPGSPSSPHHTPSPHALPTAAPVLSVAFAPPAPPPSLAPRPLERARGAPFRPPRA